MLVAYSSSTFPTAYFTMAWLTLKRWCNCVQVLTDSSYRAAAARLSVVLKTQLKRHHPYAAAADEVELAINTWLAQQPSSHRQHRQGQSAGALQCRELQDG